MSKIKIFFQIKPLTIEDNRKVLELEGKGREIVYGGRKGNILRMQECPGKKNVALVWKKQNTWESDTLGL